MDIFPGLPSRNTGTALGVTGFIHQEPGFCVRFQSSWVFVGP